MVATGRYFTTASVWIIQAEAMIIARVPRSEDGRESLVPYAELGRPVPYRDASIRGGRLVVTLADGRTAVSGPILDAP